MAAEGSLCSMQTASLQFSSLPNSLSLTKSRDEEIEINANMCTTFVVLPPRCKTGVMFTVLLVQTSLPYTDADQCQKLTRDKSQS